MSQPAAPANPTSAFLHSLDPSRTLSPRWTLPIVDDKIQIAAGKIAFSKFLRLAMSRVVAVVLCLVALTQVCAKAEEQQTSKAHAACLDKSGDDQPEAREGQAGRPGVAERFVVPRKPGNAGGGKGPQFKTDAIRGEGPG